MRSILTLLLKTEFSKVESGWQISRALKIVCYKVLGKNAEHFDESGGRVREIKTVGM